MGFVCLDRALARGGAIINADSLGSSRHKVPFNDFFRFKFLIDLDGVGSSFRLASLMLGNSVVLRPNSYIFWWSPAFEGAWIPLADDLEDLLPIIKRLKQNDTLAEGYTKKAAHAIDNGAFSQIHERQVWMQMLSFFPAQPHEDVERYLDRAPRQAPDYTCAPINGGCNCK